MDTRTDASVAGRARFSRTHGPLAYAAVIVVILAATAAVEFSMGRVPWCKCGYIKLWHGVVKSSENSQHLTDWYTFTHITHGILFYLLLRALWRGAPVGARLTAAVLIEAAWEVLENSSIVIERYRAATISLDYNGDSIVNSLADICAMMIGFGLARRLPVWATVLLVAVTELTLAAAIRDNLTLNIIMLVHPIDVIKAWQTGG